MFLLEGDNRSTTSRTMHYCGRLTKIILLLANTILFIGSVLLLGVSLWSLVDKHYILVLMNESAPFWFSICLFLLGCFTFMFSVVGCMGIVKNNKTMLVAYLILGVALFLVTVAGGINSYMLREKADTLWHTNIIKKIAMYDPNSDNAITKAFDEMQIKLKCCGMENSEDWFDYNTLFDTKNQKLPRTCCTGAKGSDCSPNLSTYFHHTGCKDDLVISISHYCLIMGTASISLGVLLLTAVMCCIGVYMEIERERNYPPKPDL